MTDRSNWAPLAAAVVGALDTPDLPQALADFLRHHVPYSHTVIFGYSGTARPIDLFDDFPQRTRGVFVTDYQAGPYLLDPFYLAAARSVASGLYRLRDLAPDRFYQGEYYRSYYVRTGLAEEIAYFVALPGPSTLVLSLMRTERTFSRREFQTLHEVFPLVEAVVRRHWKTIGQQHGKPAGLPAGQRLAGDLPDDLRSFGAGILTPREREVAAYTLKGHSAESAGQILGISSGTVRIHRQNIYAKLQINSQGELFSRFLGTIRDLR